MAFGNNNNNYQELSMNTKSNQYFNDAENGSTLITGFWNSFMTLKICPTLPANKRTEKKKYNYDTFVNTALSAEKSSALLMAANKLIVPKIARGDFDFEPVGVSVGSGFVEISNGLKHGRPESSICLAIYSKVDEAGRTNEYLVYEFNQSPYFTNYNSSTGNINKNLDQVEFFLFMIYLEEGIKAMTNAVAHSIRNVNKFASEKERNNIVNIMKKLGVEMPESGGSGNYERSKPSGFFGNNNLNNNEEGLGEEDIEYGAVNGGRLEI